MQTHLLVNALCEILEQCSSQKYYLVYLHSDLNDASDGILDVNGDNIENGGAEPESTIFHDSLRIHTFQNVEDVRKYFVEHIQSLRLQYGILLFLYSIILTRV